MNVKMQYCLLGLEQNVLVLDGQTQAMLTKYAYWYSKNNSNKNQKHHYQENFLRFFHHGLCACFRHDKQ
jgi:hypothetical protein